MNQSHPSRDDWSVLYQSKLANKMSLEMIGPFDWLLFNDLGIKGIKGNQLQE